jgi:hypothetical protein
MDIALVRCDFAGRKGVPKRASKVQGRYDAQRKSREDTTEERMSWTIPIGSLRAAGLFLLNAVVAVLGTAIIESPFEHYAHVSSLRASLLIMDLLSAAFAFGVGYSVYWRWRPAASKWVWIAGVCWFGQRAVLPLDGHHVLIWEIYATNSVFPDFERLGKWSLYTLPLLRTIFYSAGAYCCSRLHGGHCSHS